MCKNKDIIVVYKFQPHNKVNGTLFYCFEYTMQLLELDQNVNFYIYNIKDEKDKVLVEKCFKEKYKEEYYKYFNNVCFLKHTVNLAKIARNDLSVFVSFDIKTYNDYSKFAPLNKKFAYINSVKTEECYWSNHIDYSSNTTFFGFYNYQYPSKEMLIKKNSFFICEKLKIGFKYHKQYLKSDNDLVFVSAPNMESLGSKYDCYPYISKRTYYCFDNIFKNVNFIIYIHNDFDTNNRIIPEAFYHFKKFELIDMVDINDSIKHRLDLCLNDKLCELTLEPSSLIIQSIIG